MSEKLLSISVAAYNVEKYIAKTIESVINSKMSNYIQLIIVNDGSNDNTGGIAKEYAKNYPYIVNVINKINGGHGSTINEGIKVAVGKYFMVLDGDDWLETSELDKLLVIIKQQEEDTILFNHTNCYESGKIQKVIDYPSCKYEYTYFTENNDDTIRPKLASAIIKTKKIKESGYKCLEKCFYEDLQYDAFMAVLTENYIYYNLYIYNYRLGREGQSVNIESYRKNIDMQIRIYKELKTFYENNKEKWNAWKQRSVICCLAYIAKSMVGTYISYSPSKKNRDNLYKFICELKRSDVNFELCKLSGIYRILSKKFIYFPVCILYRLKYGLKD